MMTLPTHGWIHFNTAQGGRSICGLRVTLCQEVGLVTVTDQQVAAVLDPSAGLALQVPVKWKDRPSTVRAEMAVHNVHVLPLLVGMQVIKDKPWKPTVYLMLEHEHLRRLDVNGSHANRTPIASSGETAPTSIAGLKLIMTLRRTHRLASQRCR